MSVDTRGREASQRALAAVDRIHVPDASELVMSRRRRQLTRIAVLGVASIFVVTAGLLSVIDSVSGPARTQRVQVRPTTPSIAKAKIEFREVRLTVPLTGSLAGESCPAPATLFSAPEGEMFADRTGKVCYILSPVLLTGAGIDSASAAYDAASSQWLVDMKWDNDEFLTKIARPFVGKEIAIVSDGLVQSTPTINPGITGSNIEIGGNFNRTDAINLAAAIMGVASSAVHVDISGATP
jgi:preprotein translocase subunit SecD